MIPAPAAAPPSILTVECGLYAARRLQHALTAGAAREVPRPRGRGAAATRVRLLPACLLVRFRPPPRPCCYLRERPTPVAGSGCPRNRC
jgi:hypothetical protein